MADYSLAAQIKPFDAATPLANAARVQSMQAETAAQQFKQQQAELGAEARGLQAYVGTPEFPTKWAETADRLRQRGILDDRSHAQWRNTPSPLMLKALIAQTSDPSLQLQRENMDRQQANSDRTFSLQERQLEATIAGGKVPSGFQKQADGSLAPIKGGPQDPDYIERTNKAKEKPRELNFGDTSKLTEEGGKFTSINRFTENFKDEYGGKLPGTADLSNWVARTAPEALTGKTEREAAQYWQDYDRYKNVVRNDLFGSALTATEQAAFEKADINPSMNASTIRANLKTQHSILQDAMKRRANSLIASGYNPQAISQAYGVPLDKLGVTQEGRSRTGATKSAAPSGANTDAALDRARRAIEQGAPRDAVMRRLEENGIDPSGL